MIDPAELDAIDAYWRAANYLTVGQIAQQTMARVRDAIGLSG